MECPQAWERLLWSGRALVPPRARYALTDVRLVAVGRGRTDELTLYDIGEIVQTRSLTDRLLGTSTLLVRPRDPRRTPLTLRHLREGDHVAGLLELFASEACSPEGDTARTALSWTSRRRRRRDLASGLTGFVVALTTIGGAVAWQRSTADAHTTSAPPDHATMRADMLRLMEDRVMPWARVALAPIVGGPDRVTCETCHGDSEAARSWRMPAVAALPEDVVRDSGWEHYSNGMDPQLRNAIYGYAADSGKQTRATYMREVVMPGMARLLGRPAYDFTRSYDFNRRQEAFGCYHCHRVR